MKNKEKIIGSIVILCAFILFLTVGYFTTRPKKLPKEELTVESVFVQDKDKKETKDGKEVQNGKDIRVQIKGEVKKPGVYSLSTGSRIEDLVEAADGFTASADEDSVILVKKLIDSDCIIIRKKGQPSQNTVTASSDGAKEKIDLNTATLEELDKLPGIGPAKAKIIMDYRDKNGGFNSIDDLKQVKGIGEATLNKFRDIVEVRWISKNI